MSELSIQTGTRSLPAQPVFLGDDGPYTFTPRKVARVAYDIRDLQELLEQGRDDIRAVAVHRQDNWLRKGFGKEQWARIAARRADPKDPLTQHHIDLLYEAMVQSAVQMLKKI